MIALLNLLHSHKILFAVALPCWIGVVIVIEQVLLACSIDNVQTAQSLPSNEEWPDSLLMVIRIYSVK